MHGGFRRACDETRHDVANNRLKKFLLRGNVVDLAVAVVVGTAFTAVVKALVADILTPIIALIFGKPNFEGLSFTINGSHFLYGDFINSLITFLGVAAAVFFFVVAPIDQADGASRPGGPGHQGVPGVHERHPAQGEALSPLHLGARDRLGAGVPPASVGPVTPASMPALAKSLPRPRRRRAAAPR